MSETKSSNGAAESERLIGAAEEFIEDVFGALEFRFIEHFGQRWTPEINDLFQTSQRACRAAAQGMDESAASETRYAPTNRISKILSNYKEAR